MRIQVLDNLNVEIPRYDPTPRTRIEEIIPNHRVIRVQIYSYGRGALVEDVPRSNLSTIVVPIFHGDETSKHRLALFQLVRGKKWKRGPHITPPDLGFGGNVWFEGVHGVPHPSHCLSGGFRGWGNVGVVEQGRHHRGSVCRVDADFVITERMIECAGGDVRVIWRIGVLFVLSHELGIDERRIRLLEGGGKQR